MLILFKLKRIWMFFLKLVCTPTKFAILSGVSVGVNCKLGTKEFGSEPYLIKIGDNFYSSGNIQFITHDGSMHVLRNLYSEFKNVDYFGPISIGNNVFIGYGCIILPNTSIGDNVIIGAGSIVKGVLESNSIYAGCPVKKISTISDYFEKYKSKDGVLFSKGMNPLQKEKFIRDIFHV